MNTFSDEITASLSKAAMKYKNIIIMGDFNPIQDGPFWGCSRMGGDKKASLPKICYTYPTMMKLSTAIPCPKKIPKTYKSRDTPLEFC